MARPPFVIVLLLMLALLGGPALGGETPVRTKHTPASVWDGKTLTVHEWGTFTSVMGSGGVVLEGLKHEETDLPSFVHDLRDHAGVTGASPKMETPVIYFYSPEERRVHVDVRFPRGTITQWFPAASYVNHMTPMVNGQPAKPDGRRITHHADGTIRWGEIGGGDLTVMSRTAEVVPPAVGPADPWRFCREVDANLLRACTLNGSPERRTSRRGPVTYEVEKCLFYRGLGEFPLPLSATVRSESSDGADYRVDLTLGGQTLGSEGADGPLTHVFIVWVKDGRCGFTYRKSLGKAEDLKLTLPLMPLETGAALLADQMAARLVETGLFTDEARAMVNTWQQGYFRDEGLRALYVLPTAFVDRELPLRIDPKKSDADPGWRVVRTFVGRTEILSPERERSLQATIEAFAEGNPIERDNATQTLASWGRFAAPYLERVIAMADDPEVVAAARERLERLVLTR